ncbi:hypothetical protein ONZ45_g10541 [Pleurotus djamor]|nr:hypothetical protein ONZ45_g10541 [Pleurotus djamor]
MPPQAQTLPLERKMPDLRHPLRSISQMHCALPDADAVKRWSLSTPTEGPLVLLMASPSATLMSLRLRYPSADGDEFFLPPDSGLAQMIRCQPNVSSIEAISLNTRLFKDLDPAHLKARIAEAG